MDPISHTAEQVARSGGPSAAASRRQPHRLGGHGAQHPQRAGHAADLAAGSDRGAWSWRGLAFFRDYYAGGITSAAQLRDPVCDHGAGRLDKPVLRQQPIGAPELIRDAAARGRQHRCARRERLENHQRLGLIGVARGEQQQVDLAEELRLGSA